MFGYKHKPIFFKKINLETKNQFFGLWKNTYRRINNFLYVWNCMKKYDKNFLIHGNCLKRTFGQPGFLGQNTSRFNYSS